ncbi:MAG: folate-binding protein YgfZ [Anaerolineae bacterium]|nr:folate-binding protein YgfZ [Anaerolineae bacterium]
MTEHTLVFDRSQQQGRLEMVDRDRLDLLHRMSTNDFKTMQPGEGRSTVLTTALARIIDRVIVYNRSESALLVLNQPDTVRNWLQRHIFFQDKVKIRNVSNDLGQLELYGTQAATIAESIIASAGSLALHHFVEIPTDTGFIFIARTFPLHSDGYLLITPAASLDALKQAILNHAGVSEGSAEQYEALRIAAGLPGAGHELTEDYIPLEANLWDSVSFTKGCYIGQEIIARMESRNRLAKTLVSLRLDAPAPTGSRISDSERSNIGTLTSVTQTDDGAVIGLGFVKPDRAESGTRLNVVTEGETVIPAEVTHAPLLQPTRR